MGTESRIEDLLSHWEQRKREGELLSPEAVCRDCPELLDGLRTRLDALIGMAGVLEPVAHAGLGAGDTLKTQVTYRIAHEHARGGMGEVWLAHDEDLDRNVALKRIGWQHEANPLSRQRFLREAAITGRLEHPGIVPVYGLGCDEAGRPHYAMRYIHGETLHQAIVEFHARLEKQANVRETMSEWRQLLGRFVAVCNTVAYAHSRGVLHRDLKPSNILLGPYGETLVLDWGLARGASEPPDEVAMPAESPEPLIVAGVSTRIGSVMGTPAFMSPEQAAGEGDSIGPASDIFSLGATLSMIVTGRPPPPPPGADRAASTTRPVDASLAGLAPNTFARPLLAIADKAVSPRPGDRYATALELAADIEHWLADEPVTAWPDPLSVRIRRWIGRHRTLVASLGVAVFVSLGLTSAAAWLLNQAWRETGHERDTAQTQRALAETSASRARRTVDLYFTAISESEELARHGLEGLRKDLLGQAKEAYQAFVKEESDNPDVRAEQGRTLRRLAHIARLTGSGTEADGLYRQALDNFENLEKQHPNNLVYPAEQALCWVGLAAWRRERGSLSEAEAAAQRALALRERLAAADKDNPARQSDLADVLNVLGSVYRGMSKPAQANDALRRGIAILEAVCALEPGNAVYARQLAQLRNGLGLSLRTEGNALASQEVFRTAAQTAETLAQAEPDSLPQLELLATIHNNLGIGYENAERYPDALVAYRRAAELRERMVDASPAAHANQYALAAINQNLGNVLDSLARPHEAESAYRRGAELLKRLARVYPRLVQYSVGYARACINLGRLEAQRGRPDQSIEWFDTSVNVLTGILSSGSNLPQARTSLVNALCGRADAQSSRGRFPEAQADVAKARAIEDRVHAGKVSMTSAIVLGRAGKIDEAAALLGPLAGRADLDAATLFDLALGYAICAAQAPPRDADRYAAQALELLRSCQRIEGLIGGNVSRLQKDKAFASLRSRPEFRKLLEELAGAKP